LRAVSAEVGARVPIVSWGRWGVAGMGSLLGERVVVRRTDVSGAVDHPYWDAGGVAGVQGAWQARSWLRFAVFADAGYRPTRRVVQIPDGPSLRVNAWSVRSGIGGGVTW
jgi:hypothetical protein